ncbi:DNA mismatch repair endonuclease MutL [Candidatus Woesearchaeota archaeon]|nr:DNA mismatch repair endonuclease MutL [Candidatus Woesearchaeota archaeon]
MGVIKELDQDLINKIAAGEVIERPASVVKELVENAIDAHARTIIISVIEGGKSLIKISDNGCGISSDEAELALKRHTTSKIETLNDLFNIKSLGFRGEALASIASVSSMELVTKTAEEDTGTYLEVVSGDIVQKKSVAANKGTAISVHNLFFNVPARKQHQKTIATEFRYILELVTHYALIHPEINITLIHNEKEVLNAPSTEDVLTNIASVYGRGLCGDLLPVDFSFFDLHVSGFISIPGKARNDKNFQSIFVNKRFVHNYLIQKAVYDGYGSLLFHGKHPVFVLNVTIDPKKIDVNVHPTKAQIRIEKESDVYISVKNAVIKTLKEHNLVPEMFSNKQDFPRDINAKLVIDPFPQEEQLYLDEDVDLLRKKEVGIRILGRIYQTFIIAEDDKGMLLIDQHAAHERVMFEKFMQQYQNKAIKVQQLLQPIMLELSALETDVVINNISILENCGIFIEEFGKNTFLVRSLPSIFARQQDKNIVLAIIGELGSGELKTISLVKEERIAMAACRSVVKAHDILEMPELYALLQELFSCKNPYSCPHGRPSMIHYSLYDLEKKFKRRV